MTPAFRLIAIFILATAATAQRDRPLLESEFLFPLEHWHNHASSLVELPNGDLFAVWYHGSGERTADDVILESARKLRGRKEWTPRETIADTPGFPDCNPALLLDSKQRLWLFWPVILANEWHTALLKYRVSTNYATTGLPKWDSSEELLFKPLNFTERVREAISQRLKAAEPGSQLETYLKTISERAGDKYFMRMGWMPRVHPIELPSGRILVPLYSDGYDFSIMALTDDGGRTWRSSEPLPGAGNVQPSIVRRRDGSLVAYFRDNGPAPKRILISESKDEGVTWSPAVDTDLPNPGAGIEAIVLGDTTWALIYNDTERERYSLAVALSDDEGRTWKWKRHLELDSRSERRASYHYPSIIQSRDGSLHATYSYFLNHLPSGAPRKTIKHARFNTAWVKEGDPR
jgi:predicted neuraminidase